jgi:hypothetical protein
VDGVVAAGACGALSQATKPSAKATLAANKVTFFIVIGSVTGGMVKLFGYSSASNWRGAMYDGGKL